MNKMNLILPIVDDALRCILLEWIGDDAITFAALDLALCHRLSREKYLRCLEQQKRFNLEFNYVFPSYLKGSSIETKFNSFLYWVRLKKEARVTGLSLTKSFPIQQMVWEDIRHVQNLSLSLNGQELNIIKVMEVLTELRVLNISGKGSIAPLFGENYAILFTLTGLKLETVELNFVDIDTVGLELLYEYWGTYASNLKRLWLKVRSRDCRQFLYLLKYCTNLTEFSFVNTFLENKDINIVEEVFPLSTFNEISFPKMRKLTFQGYYRILVMILSKFTNLEELKIKSSFHYEATSDAELFALLCSEKFAGLKSFALIVPDDAYSELLIQASFIEKLEQLEISSFVSDVAFTSFATQYHALQVLKCSMLNDTDLVLLSQGASGLHQLKKLEMRISRLFDTNLFQKLDFSFPLLNDFSTTTVLPQLKELIIDISYLNECEDDQVMVFHAIMMSPLHKQLTDLKIHCIAQGYQNGLYFSRNSKNIKVWKEEGIRWDLIPIWEKLRNAYLEVPLYDLNSFFERVPQLEVFHFDGVFDEGKPRRGLGKGGINPLSDMVLYESNQDVLLSSPKETFGHVKSLRSFSCFISSYLSIQPQIWRDILYSCPFLHTLKVFDENSGVDEMYNGDDEKSPCLWLKEGYAELRREFRGRVIFDEYIKDSEEKN